MDLMEGIPVNNVVAMLTGKNSKWPNKGLDVPTIKKFITQDLTAVDPTGDKGKYTTYIAKQLAAGPSVIRCGPDSMEDADRLARVLAWYDKGIQSARWEYDRGLEHFPNWRTLEDLYEKGGGKDVISNTELENKMRAYASGYKTVYETTISGASVGDISFRIVEVLEPEAMALLGNNTRWCTSELQPAYEGEDPTGQSLTYGSRGKVSPITDPNHVPPTMTYPSWHPKAGQTRNLEYLKKGQHEGYPKTARYYLQKNREHIIFRKVANGEWEPYWQFDGSQVMNAEDKAITRVSNVTDLVLGKWSNDVADAPLNLINRARKTWSARQVRDPNTGKPVPDAYLEMRPPMREAAKSEYPSDPSNVADGME